MAGWPWHPSPSPACRQTCTPFAVRCSGGSLQLDAILPPGPGAVVGAKRGRQQRYLEAECLKRSKAQEVEPLVADLARPIIAERALELVDVEYVKEGSQRYLRLYIDKEGGVDFDDCEAVSRYVGKKLDELDPIPEAYFLEVSSPGIERPLKREADFVRFRGHAVACHLFAPVAGQKLWVGELLGLVDGQILLRDESGQEIRLPREACAKVHLHAF
jgi:ribosome maturation factor RimP